MAYRFMAAAVLALGVAGTAQAADPVQGDWLTEGGSAKVRVAPCAGDAAKMCGTIVWLKGAKPGVVSKDVNNPDPALRSRPLMGLALIRDFKPAGPGKWKDGKIYDPSAGKTYASKISATGDGALKVEGCISVICKAQTWKKAG